MPRILLKGNRIERLSKEMTEGGELKRLRDLDLSENLIDEISDDFGKMISQNT